MNELKVNSINDFMKKIRLLYPASFKEDGSYEVYSSTCVEVLYNSKVDYFKLFKFTAANNPNGNFAPDIAWLIEKSKLCYKKEAKEQQKKARREVKFSPPYFKSDGYIIDYFPLNTTDEQVLGTYKKIFPYWDYEKEPWRIVLHG